MFPYAHYNGLNVEEDVEQLEFSSGACGYKYAWPLLESSVAMWRL